ncbi:PREDICTED: uncharacterized protein LOC100636944 [Amphimedon queenslandica]|uniref:EIF-4F 25 kDa subunit n=1 Tax=Amphimedon queenslandica TaxID=400682 RepID=A0AAN0IWJ5_AMPQE|nr:PREDICTED: uncharacterized protein LOC100636944 [Amphimedon queenslandica]|eukprot:XP_019848927.1 PREDICTED: uncharacterized protein LOC100636944 [Amphimedon queenslandica]
MKVDYLRSLTSDTNSAASKLRRGISFEIDDCKFHLKAMTSPDYQPLVDNKRIIEKLQERITLMNMELMTERERNEKIIKDIKDLKDEETEGAGDEETRNKRIGHDSLNDETKDQICSFTLYCNHPVTEEFMDSILEVHKDELLPTVLDKAYELMELAPFIPIERCRLVKYSYEDDVMEQSLDLDEFQHQTIGQIAGGTRHYPFDLFIETREENEIFDKYNEGGNNIILMNKTEHLISAPERHPLQNKWVLWYLKNDKQKKWKDNLRKIICIDTVEEFWSVYNHIKPPSRISSGCDYMLFKEGIEPMWDDKANKDGGRWLLNIDKRERKDGVLDNVWIETLMCLIGEVFGDSSDDICGAMVRNRTKGDKISIWTRFAKNKEHVHKIGHVYKEKVQVHIHRRFQIQYQSHLDVAKKIGSSSRALFTI